MPIYEYVCSACSHRTDILHGVHDAGPTFCPACGAVGTMRKAFAPPTIHFKGSGWAKKERRSASAAAKKSEGGGSDGSAAKDATSGGAPEGGEAGPTDAGSGRTAPAAPTAGD